MNNSKITVRLNDEGREASLEILKSEGTTSPFHVTQALRKIGIRSLGTTEFLTPRHHVVRSKLSNVDGTPLDTSRVMQVLSIVSAPKSAPQLAPSWAA